VQSSHQKVEAADKAGVSAEEVRKNLEECNGEPAKAMIKQMSRPVPSPPFLGLTALQTIPDSTHI